jgi:hypothetical protein
VTQIPLSAKIYENVLETIREPLAIHFNGENTLPKKGKESEVSYDQFCHDFLQLFGIE